MLPLRPPDRSAARQPQLRPFKRKERAILACAADIQQMPSRATGAGDVLAKLRKFRMAFEADEQQADEQQADEDFLDTDERPVEGAVHGGGEIDTVGECDDIAWAKDLVDTREMKRLKVNDWVRCCSAGRVSGD